MADVAEVLTHINAIATQDTLDIGVIAQLMVCFQLFVYNFVCRSSVCLFTFFGQLNLFTLISECLANPCQNRGTCVDRADGYECRCLPGTWGKNCELNENNCRDNPCIHGECIDGINSYQV